MKKRNLLVCIIILLSFLPIVVIAQLDINRLKTDKRGFGFGYRSYDTNEKIHGILASGDYGITESTKYSGQVNIIFSEEHYDSMIIDFRNQLIHSDSVQIPSDGLSGIDFGYFLLGGIDIAYLYFVQTTQEVTRLYYGEYYFESYGKTTQEIKERFIGMNFFAGGGIYATFNALKPFLRYTINHRRIFEGFGGNSLNEHYLSYGIHLNLSNSTSLMGMGISQVTSKGFRLPSFEFGINFGLGKTD